MGTTTRPSATSLKPPLGTSGEHRRRLLYHHLPLGGASVVALLLFLNLSLLDASNYPHGDIFSGAFPQQRAENHGRHMDHGADHTGPGRHGRSHPSNPAPRTGDAESRLHSRSFVRQFTLATGYVALGLLALTLLVGPANLLLGRRNPVSSYLRRDVGAWTAIAGVAHVIFGFAGAR